MTDFSIEHSALLNAPASQVHALLNDLHAWEAWSPWQDADPHMTQTYSGPESGPGARMHWSGNRKAGEGAMEILASAPSRIDVGLSFIKPFVAENRVSFMLTPENDDAATRITWRMTGQQSRFEKALFTVLGMRKKIEADFARGTERLRRIVEA